MVTLSRSSTSHPILATTHNRGLPPTRSVSFPIPTLISIHTGIGTWTKTNLHPRSDGLRTMMMDIIMDLSTMTMVMSSSTTTTLSIKTHPPRIRHVISPSIQHKYPRPPSLTLQPHTHRNLSSTSISMHTETVIPLYPLRRTRSSPNQRYPSALPTELITCLGCRQSPTSLFSPRIRPVRREERLLGQLQRHCFQRGRSRCRRSR